MSLSSGRGARQQRHDETRRRARCRAETPERPFLSLSLSQESVVSRHVAVCSTVVERVSVLGRNIALATLRLGTAPAHFSKGGKNPEIFARRRRERSARDGRRVPLARDRSDLHFVPRNYGTFQVSDWDFGQFQRLEHVSCGSPEHGPSCW